ncbi:hypothetical protein HPQ64_13680 [Rhizobiales bacterium]|uniref:hypothetical protein n=1 Tax=Hongsoonwoonella zoysiae TaxID=2821844 RepID=UPI0015607E89|nr:hypothetical protein [Hongsoonwoonella zoysiae]NRG18738.1 hypothetical protein [Hongsoonwoonella zoysiae]
MSEDKSPTVGASSVEMEFVKGHIAATMVLIQGLWEQNLLDKEALERYFTKYLENLPSDRTTLPLRLIIDQWREDLRNGMTSSELKGKVLSVIESDEMGGS